MSIIRCSECDKEYSDKAIACPNCGCPTEQSHEQHIRCKECNYEYRSDENFCSECGCPNEYNLNGSPNEQQNKNGKFKEKEYINEGTIGDETLDDEYIWTQLIDEKSDYYISKFRKLKITNEYFSWNWAAALTLYWFVYRRMYSTAVAIGLISIIGMATVPFLIIFLPLITGIFGNYIYMKHIESKVKHYKNMKEKERDILLENFSGVAIKETVIAIVVMVFIQFIISTNL